MINFFGIVVSFLALLYIFAQQQKKGGAQKNGAGPELQKVRKQLAEPLAAAPLKMGKKASKHIYQPQEKLVVQYSASLAMPAREEHIQRKFSRGHLSLNRLKNRRDLLIYQEIMDKPKSLR